MTKKLPASIILIMFGLSVFAQTVNSWFELFSSVRIHTLRAGDKKIFGAAKNTVIIYDTQTRETERLATMAELSDYDISDIFYSPDFKTLIIAYKSGNIDMLADNTVVNLPFLSQDPSIPDKTLTSVCADRNFFYAAGHFGIIRIDPLNRIFTDKCIFPDTYYIRDIAYCNGRLFAATDYGLYAVDTNDGFADFNQWQQIFSAGIRQLRPAGQTLYFLVYNNNVTEIYKFDGTNISLVISQPGTYEFNTVESHIYLYAQDILLFDTLGNPAGTITPSIDLPRYVSDLLQADNHIYTADLYHGLIIDFSQPVYAPDSPVSDNISYVLAEDQRTVILYKPDSIDSITQTLAFYSIKKDQTWQHYYLPANAYLSCVISDPSDPDRLFFGTHGAGLIETRNNQITNIFDNSNSPMRGDDGTIKISWMLTDKNRKLWILASESQYPVVKYDLDANQWEIVNLASPAAHKTTGNFFIDKRNRLWATLFSNGVLVIDFDNGLSKAFYPQPAIGSSILNLAEDYDGFIWMATTDGIGYLDAENLNDITVIRPKVSITLNDTTIYAYLLDNVTVTSIAVDAANRKWAGTKLAGIFFLSPDGLQQYGSFGRFNGKLPARDVYYIFQDQNKGELFFVTDAGLIGYRSDASAPANNFETVKIYPNPLRPGQPALITISGLMYNTLIKITDIEGKTVYETVSRGGTATWNGCTPDGNPVASGVYLVFCIDEQNNNKCVKKLLIVR